MKEKLNLSKFDDEIIDAQLDIVANNTLDKEAAAVVFYKDYIPSIILPHTLSDEEEIPQAGFMADKIDTIFAKEKTSQTFIDEIEWLYNIACVRNNVILKW